MKHRILLALAATGLLGATAFGLYGIEGKAADTGETMIADVPAGGVVLLENVRFHKGEEKNDPALASQMAALGDVYVNDAFVKQAQKDGLLP